MMRYVFDEPKRIDSGHLLKSFTALTEYLSHLQRLLQVGKIADRRIRQWEVWVKSFRSALDELEQSQYCCIQYSKHIHHKYVEQMREDELDHYYRHVYFYKNAFIRIFSILDKLGYFLNDLLQLQTERVKSRFSYFTVLRQMHDHKIAVELEQQLYDYKMKYQVPLNKLRDQRNLEIHAMNYEMSDDLQHAERAHGDSWSHIENIPENLRNLELGCEMVYLSVQTVFSFARHLHHSKTKK